MASKALRQFIEGATNPKGDVGDFQHAARLFVDDDMRLAPKLRFQYHVVFSINSQAIRSLNFTYRHQNEINMLVKTADMPKFQISTDSLNQYNRRKVVQTKIDYQPVNITFHEDNFGVVRQLWENYYGYYYADADASKVYGNYNRTATLGSGFIRTPYGLDNNSSVPFFNSITIYQFARRQFTSATLVNPVITSWSGDTMNHADSGPVQNTMTLAYEAVNYNAGSVFPNNPPGFGLDHYDTVPSPISINGGGTPTLLGAGGVLSGVEQVFGRIASGQAFDSPLDFLSTAITAVNTYQNSKSLTNAGVRNELQNVALRGITAAARPGAAAINNTVFPVNDSGNANITVANRRNLTGG